MVQKLPTVIAPLFLDSRNNEMRLVFLLPFRSLKFVAIVCLISIQSQLRVTREHIM